MKSIKTFSQRRMQVILIVSLSICSILYSNGFHRTTSTQTRSYSHLFAVSGPNSYLNLRNQYLQQQGKQPIQQPQSVSTPTPTSYTPSPVYEQEQEQVEEDKDVNYNGLPFSDELYEDFKYVISKLIHTILQLIFLYSYLSTILLYTCLS